MKATDRHKARVAALTGSSMDGDDLLSGDDFQPFESFDGAASGDVASYLPLAAGMISEITSKELKKKEDKEAEAKMKATEGYKAQQAANEAQKKSAMAAADAMTEADPNGPKHRMAASLALEAQAAQAKAMYFSSQMPGLIPGYAPQNPSIFTAKNVAIGGAVVLAVGLVVYAAKKRK